MSADDMEALIERVALPWLEEAEQSFDTEELAEAGQAVRALLKAYQEQRRALEAASPVVPVGVSREEIARIVARDLARQDLIDDWQPDAGWDLTWGYVDQDHVDFGEIADAILAALRSTDTGASHD
jgi:hypothetical protein